MKQCTVCGCTTSSKLVYDLPCEEIACDGTMIFFGAPLSTEPTDEATEEPTIPGPTVITVTTLPEMVRKMVVARFSDVEPHDRVDQVLAFIDRRAAALDDLGASAGADLLRNLIAAIRVEFRS